MPEKAQGRHHTRATTELLALISNCGLSDRKVSILATGSADTVRNLRRGASPRCNTMEALCSVLGVEARLKPTMGPTRSETEQARPETSFDDGTQLPVRRWAGRTVDGILEESAGTSAPAPEGWNDLHAFYRVAVGNELQPAGIRGGDVCLISPAAELRRDTIGWFRRSDGSETMGWTAGLTPDGFQVVLWTEDGEGGRAAPGARLVRRDAINDRGVVVRVYETTPRANKPLQPRAAWTPDAANALWQSAVIDGNSAVQRMLDAIEECAGKVDRAGRAIRELRTDGRISEAQAGHCTVAMETLVQRSVDRLHASIRRRSQGAKRRS